MFINLKDGVNIQHLHAGIYKAIYIASGVFANHGHQTLTITSGRDGKHLPDSLHYIGRAIDIRTWGFQYVDKLGRDLRDALGSEYYVLVETDHIHLSYPGTTGLH